MARMTAARALVECIRREGVDHVFCVPGESYLPVLDVLGELEAGGQVRVVSARHEEGAVFMADGYARATGRPGVVLATRGPGSTNLAIGLHTARHDSTPLVAFIGQVPTTFRHREALQEIDLVATFRPLTKWAVEVDRADRVAELAQRAFRVAQAGRPGPVLVSLPVDVLDGEADYAFRASTAPAPSRPDAAAVARAAELLAASERPAILAGGGVLRARASDRLAALAEAVGAPIFAAFRRLDVIPNDHPHYLGWTGSVALGCAPSTVARLKGADVILAVGTRLSQLSTFDYTLLAGGARLVHVDADPEVVGATFEAEVAMVADAALALDDLLAAVRRLIPPDDPRRRARLERLRADREAYRVEVTPELPDDDAGGVNPEWVVVALRDLLDDADIVVSDAGNFSGWLGRYFPFRRPGTYHGPTSGAMGFGLPAAIGVQMARPEQRVVAVCGDGGFLMVVQELETAVRYGVPVVAVVLNNFMYGTIRMNQEREFPGRVVGSDLGNPDLAKLAEAFGAHGERVTRDAEVRPALKRALAAGKPAVVDVLTNRQRISVMGTIEDFRRAGRPSGAERWSL